MCLLTLIPTANKDGKIQQENQLTSSKDGSKDLQIQQFSNIEESNECEYSSTLQYKAEPPLKVEMIRNATMSVIHPISDQRQFKILKAEFQERIRKDQRQIFKIMLEVHRKMIEKILEDHRKMIEKILEDERKELEKQIHRKMIEKILEDERKELEKKKIKEKELKEYISQIFLMMLLFLLIKNIGENITCRQTSCRKYPCLNSILFLLWRSGDVEANPGPPNSISYRNWLYDVCSVVRKVIAGVSTDCKMKNIWQKSPKNWPSEELYFDPRNSNRCVNEVETFLHILIQCCHDISKLSDEIISEIYTWNYHKSKDNVQLLNMYTSRVCCRSAEKNVKLIRSNLLVDEELRLEVKTGIHVSLSRQSATDQQFPTHKMYRAEATRKIASFQCKILHGKDPEKKCDDIWTKKPDWWPSNRRYYNPNNGGKRCAENEDAMLVETMITRCEKKSIILQKPYQDMVEAWRADDQMLLSKLMTRHTAETDLKKAVIKLHEEGLLQDSEVDKHLRELGLLVQCDGSIQNSKSQKRKMVNTTNKHETRKRKLPDHEELLDTTLNELLPDCSIGKFLDKSSDSDLLDMISKKISASLDDAFNDL